MSLRAPTLQKILECVTVMLCQFKIAVQGVDFARGSLAEGELVDTVRKVVGVVVDHDS